MRVLSVSEKYNRRPSEIMGAEDEYTAFCFDEACAYILHKMTGDGKKKGETPRWSEDREESEAAETEDLVEFLKGFGEKKRING